MTEDSRQQALRHMHDEVASFVKHLDELTRDLTPDQAAGLTDEARHLLTVVTFLRDATVDLLETGGLPEVNAGKAAGPEPIDAD